jgi:hypothetical protein
MLDLNPFTLHALLDNEIRTDKGNNFYDALHLMNAHIKKFFISNKIIKYGLHAFHDYYSFVEYNIDKMNYLLYCIVISQHAICILLDNMNQLLIVVNTGLQIDKFHKKINDYKYYPFVIFNTQCYNTFIKYISIIKINEDISDKENFIIINNINELYIFLNYINNNNINDIYEINDILKTFKYKYDDSNDKLLKIFDLNSINQVSGSCTFYSLFMSIYYLLYFTDKDYDNTIVNFKTHIINSEIEYIKKNLIVNENNIEYVKIINRKYNNILINKIKLYYANINETKNINIKYEGLNINNNNNDMPLIKDLLYNINYVHNEELLNYIYSNNKINITQLTNNNNIFDLLYLFATIENKDNITSLLIDLNYEDILNNSINQINNYNNPLLFIYYIYYILYTKNYYYVIIYLINYLENENINYKLDEKNFKLSLIYIYNIIDNINSNKLDYLIYNIKSYLLLFLLNIIKSNNIINKSISTSIKLNIKSSYDIIINNYNIKKQLSLLLNEYKYFMPNNDNYKHLILGYILNEYKDIISILLNTLSCLFNLFNHYEQFATLKVFYYTDCPYITLCEKSEYIILKEKLLHKNKIVFKNTILKFNDFKEILLTTTIKYSFISFYDSYISYCRSYTQKPMNYLSPNIFNFPKLLKNIFDNNKVDINIKNNYNENLLLPCNITSSDEILFSNNDNNNNLFLYSNYIDENNNYYEYERKNFIDSFLILDDNILSNTNYISLLMNIYMQCYNYNYIDNDKFFKLKIFLINNINLLKIINKNYIYYFNEYYNIDIKNIINEFNNSYIIVKCNDILKFNNNISINDMNILNISINNNKYIYKNVYYKHLDDLSFVHINNTKLYIFTNDNGEKIAIHPNFPDLYIIDNKYYFDYQNIKKELDINIVYNLNFFTQLYKSNGSENILYTNYIYYNDKIEFYIDLDNDIINNKYKIIWSLKEIDITIKFFIYKKSENILLVQDILTHDYYIIVNNNFINNDEYNYFNNQGIFLNYIDTIRKIKYLLIKLIKINDIYIPEIIDFNSAVIILLICNFYMDYTIINFIYNKCKLYLKFQIENLICGPFTNFYNNYENKYIQQNIESYYNDYKFSSDLSYIEKIFYYPSISINYNKAELKAQFINQIKNINNITTDNIFKQLSESITQETIINDIKDSNNKVYELLMGSGKSKFIIPYYLFFTKYIDSIEDESIDLEYFYKDNIFKILYDEYMIITPSHLINSMYNILSNFIYLLPKNIRLKKIIFNNYYLENSMYYFKKNQIIIIDDITIKYNLLKNTEEIINKNRFLLIDEIDDLINPVKSEFNLLINYDNKLPQKEILLELIYDIMLKYNVIGFNIKQYIFNLKLDNIINFIKCYFKSNDDNENCNIKNVENKIFYLVKKILDTIKQTDELILNKHYGLGHNNNEESYYFAQPYSGLNLPIKNSHFNDYILTLILTTLIFINKSFVFRDKDYSNIINLIYKSTDPDFDKIKIKLNNKKINELSTIVKNEIEKHKNKYVKFYLLNFILPNIKYLNKYINTSFIEILNPINYKKLIGFTGTIELIEKFNPKFKDDENLLSFYKINELKQKGIINLTSTTEIIRKYNNEEDLIKELLNLDKKYNVIIDNGSYLKEKLVFEYVQLFLEKYDTVVYFNDNHEPKMVSKKNEIDYNIDLLTENYLIFFDINHCRGTDIKIPNCNGIITLNKFNNLVDTLQSIYRLRNISHGQNVDYYYTNINENLTKDNIFKYLEVKLQNDLNKINKIFLIHNINSLKKFKNNNYMYDIIETYIYPKDEISLNDIKKKDLELEDTFNKICKKKKINCDNLEKLIVNNIHSLNISTSVSRNISTNVSRNISTNVSTNISIIQNKSQVYNYILDNNIINIAIDIDDYYNKYFYNNREITLYEYYIINILLLLKKI